jgi:peptide/nickel transport system substrate-binding protein
MRSGAALLLAGLLLGTPAQAQALPGDCGTIIVPPGLGIGPGADVTSLNPLFITSEYNLEAAYLVFEQLLWVNRDHQIDYTRSVASAVTTPDQGQTYDITLRPWEWSDGVPVTSADVLYTWQLIRAYGHRYAQYGLGGVPALVASVTAPDAAHVLIKLTRPVNPQWFILNGLPLFIPLPAHVWGQYSTDQIWQGQSDPAFFAVADGPLRLTALNVGIDAEFAPNPRYGGTPMHFSRFIMRFEDAEAKQLQAAQAGELDIANIPFALYAKAVTLPGHYVVTLPPPYSWHELIPNMTNTTTPFFADLRVRQALADGIDQDRLIALAMHGHGVPAHGPVPAVPDTFLSPAAKAGQYPTGYNLAAARALLAQAGFTPGPDGILRKGNLRFAFTLEIPAGQPLRIEMAESIQQDLRALGIDMDVRQVELNQLLTAMINRPQAWQAILVGMTLSPYPSGEELFAHGAFFNNNGYASAQMDQLIAQSTTAPGLSGLYAYQDYAAAQQPVIFLPAPQYSVLVRDGLHGVEDFINPLGLWAPEKLTCGAP